MTASASKNPFRPAPGSSITVDPIRNLMAIKAIKKNLEAHPRNLCLFTFGINTAYRGGEILSLKVGQVAHLHPGDRLNLKQGKTAKYRDATLNHTVITSIQNWLAVHPNLQANAPLFRSRRGNAALGVPALNRLVKQWCADVGLSGNYGSHTLRKTWGYHERTFNHAPVPLLMKAYGHATESQTLAYLGIQPDEIRALYEMEL